MHVVGVVSVYILRQSSFRSVSSEKTKALLFTGNLSNRCLLILEYLFYFCKMRKTRLVILPAKCINHVGFLLLFLSCPVIGDWGRIRPDSEMSHKAILIERAGTCGLERDDPGIPEILKPDGFFVCQHGDSQYSNDTVDATSNVALDNVEEPVESGSVQRRESFRRIDIRTRSYDRWIRSISEASRDSVMRSRRDTNERRISAERRRDLSREGSERRSFIENRRELSRERNERVRGASENRIRRERENSVRSRSLDLSRREHENRRNFERRMSLERRERESEQRFSRNLERRTSVERRERESERRLSGSLERRMSLERRERENERRLPLNLERRMSLERRERESERTRRDSDARNQRIESRRLSASRRERESRNSENRERFDQRLARSDMERRVSERRSMSVDRERDARLSIRRQPERRIREQRANERRSFRSTSERRLVKDAERNSEERRLDQRRLSLTRRERENTERNVRNAENNRRDNRQSERRLNLARNSENRDDTRRNTRSTERSYESAERRAVVENRRSENRNLNLASIRRDNKESRVRSVIAYSRLDKETRDEARRELTGRRVVMGKPTQKYFYQLKEDELDVYDGIVPQKHNLHDQITQWIGFQWLQNPTVSKIGDWTVNCALGAAVFYLTSRQVKTV